MRRLLAAAVLAGLATGCGASNGGAAPSGATSPGASPPALTASPGAPSAAAMERSRFFTLLDHNGDAVVFHRDGYTDPRIEALFRQACDDIHRGASVDETFVKHQREVSGSGGADTDALANAFADAWGAALTTFCPDVTRR